jgi:hypothetical protein
MVATTKPYIGRTGIGLTAWTLRIVAAASLAAAVALPVHRLTQSGGRVTVTPTELAVGGPLDLPGLPDGVSVVDGDAAAVLHAAELPAALRLLTELPFSVVAVGIAVGAWLLAQVLATVAAGRPFERRNPARLAGVAGAVLLGGFLAPLTENVVALVVLEHLDLTGPDSPFQLVLATISFLPIGLALVALAAAEAFRRGGALAHDVEGLV